MRLGLLECDHVDPRFRDIAGDYEDMFRSLFSPYADRAEFVVFDAVNGVLPSSVDACDAYLATGSVRSVYEVHPWLDDLKSFVRQLHESRKPLVGVCFGHQLIAEALGGKVEKANQGWAVGVHTFAVHSREAWMQPQRTDFNVVMSCQDQVRTLPPGAQVIAGNDVCPVGMMLVGDHFLGIQGHPELPPAYLARALETRRDRIGDETVDEALKTLSRPVHDEDLARWMMRFLEASLARDAGAEHDTDSALAEVAS